ncbi:hypothetical protein BGZ92_003530 [Podila epicladia]|nr:hypothetical protein BGZ92_003530 [Podila epicladia]
MPTCNSLLGNVQASLFSGSTASSSSTGDRQDTPIHSHNHQASQHHPHSQHPHPQPPQPQPQPQSQTQHLQPLTTLHTPSHKHHHLFQNHATQVHSSQSSLGPDPAVMEFISKIGQIIIKARTVSATLAVHNQTLSTSSNLPFQQGIYRNIDQHSLENVLQDMELWRNSTPVHVNILHAAQHVLLERWVISFTPPAPTHVSPRTPGDLSGTKGPFSGYLSPKSKHAPSSPPMSQNKDTTDLVLLLQSLYTQIRSLPLQNCLTSFEEKTKLTKADLDYSVTSAHEDITQPRHDRSHYGYHRYGGADDNRDMLMDGDYTDFTSSLKSTLPLEFVPVASLKVLNFEASHMQWGCVRVTGMYDESVGGRIAPENFQDSTKIQKKKHHRSRASNHAGTQEDPVAKLAKRQQKDSEIWTSKLTLDKAKVSDASESAVTTAHSSTGSLKDTEMSDTSASGNLQHLRSSSPIPSPEDQFHARLQALKRIEATNTTDHGDRRLPPVVLQESAMPKHDDTQPTAAQREERMQSYQFPPPPSPPLSIPQPKTDQSGSVWSQSSPADSYHSIPSSHVDISPPRHPHSATHHGSPYTHTAYQHAHCPVSTSPLAHVITRRRSSRLSIVMTCNDDSPDATRPQSPEESLNDHDRALQQLEQDQDHGSMARPQYQRRGSHQDHRPVLESQASHRAHSPTRYSFLRRSSLNPSSFPHGDLFGSLVGSYEESILSGRMSTLPSKPLMFTSQIGVLASQDYKDCPPKLRCPKHVLLEFPAVFYDYESSSKHQHHHHHSHSHSQHNSAHSHHHSHSASYGQGHSHAHGHHSQFNTHSHSKTSGGHSFNQHPLFSQSFNSLGSFSSSPIAPSSLSVGLTGPATVGSLPRSIPSAHDDPILPYVGNLDLDNALRGERRFARMPGGMRIPLRGQVQVVIKNPNKTAVKVFLVPYDFSDMPSGTKTFLRQKHYSTGPGMGPSSGQGGTLRYAIHLQFCCPAPGYVYLYRSIRVVFANRVPDGKESLRVVMEGLGMSSRTIQPVSESSGTTEGLSSKPLSRQQTLEDRYVAMRKGEVMFTGKKRKDASADATPTMSSLNGHFHTPVVGIGLGLDRNSLHPHQTQPSYSHAHSALNFDGEPVSNTHNTRITNAHSHDMDVDMESDPSAPVPSRFDTGANVSPLHLMQSDNRSHFQIKSPKMVGSNSIHTSDGEFDDYRSIPSSVLIGTPAASMFAPLTTKASTILTSPKLSSSPLTSPFFAKEQSRFYDTGTPGSRDKSRMLNL